MLAAAIKMGADAIVTFNLKDFPNSALAGYGVEAIHPDDFDYNHSAKTRATQTVSALRAHIELI